MPSRIISKFKACYIGPGIIHDVPFYYCSKYRMYFCNDDMFPEYKNVEITLQKAKPRTKHTKISVEENGMKFYPFVKVNGQRKPTVNECRAFLTNLINKGKIKPGETFYLRAKEIIK